MEDLEKQKQQIATIKIQLITNIDEMQPLFHKIEQKLKELEEAISALCNFEIRIYSKNS